LTPSNMDRASQAPPEDFLMAVPVGAMLLWFVLIAAIFATQALDLTAIFVIPAFGAIGYIVGAPLGTLSAVRALQRWRRTRQIRVATVALLIGVGLFLVSPWLTMLLIKFVQSGG
jgi:uncharacterized membrane protein